MMQVSGTKAHGQPPDKSMADYPLYAHRISHYLLSMDDVTCFTALASASAAVTMCLPKSVSIISRSVLSRMFRGTVRRRFFLGD